MSMETKANMDDEKYRNSHCTLLFLEIPLNVCYPLNKLDVLDFEVLAHNIFLFNLMFEKRLIL